MTAPTSRSRRFVRSTAGLMAMAAAVLGVVTLASPAEADTTFCSGTSYSTCTNAGYTDHAYGAHSANSYWGMYAGHNCTNYAAYALQTVNGVAYPGYSLGNGSQWAARASSHGVSVNGTPGLGSIAQWNSYAGGTTADGHVAYVEAINPDGSITVSEDAYPSGPFRWRVISRGSTRWPSNFIHFKDRSNYIGTIVQWYNGSSQPNTSWIVKQDAKRYWIPDVATYICMVGIGYMNKGVQSSSVLNSLPDTGQWARCTIRPKTTKDRLYVGQGLYQGQSIASGDGRYTLVLQQDHNLVVYGPTGVWATNRYTGGYVIMQSDCNFVGYDMWNLAKWATNTGGVGTSCTLVMQNDGNLVIYRGGDGRAVWDRYRGRLV